MDSRTDAGGWTEAEFVAKLADALATAYRRAGGIAHIARRSGGAATIRNIAALEAGALYRAALARAAPLTSEKGDEG